MRLPCSQFHSNSSSHQTEISSQRSGRIPPLLAQHFASVTWELFVTANAKLLIFCVFCIIPARHWGNPQCRTRAIHFTFKLTFKKLPVSAGDSPFSAATSKQGALRAVFPHVWATYRWRTAIAWKIKQHLNGNHPSSFFLVRLWYWNIGSEKGSMMDNGLFFEVSSLFCFRSKNSYFANVSPAYICQNDRKF